MARCYFKYKGEFCGYYDIETMPLTLAIEKKFKNNYLLLFFCLCLIMAWAH